MNTMANIDQVRAEGLMHINLFIILGAADPEMNTVERICCEAGIPYGYATFNGVRVHPGNAYKADGVEIAISQEIGRTSKYVTVECQITAGVGADAVMNLDHHRPGDYGYGKGPEEYLDASSIGQFCRLLALLTSPLPASEYASLVKRYNGLVVAANDHSLPYAVRGQCPGVSPQEIFNYRLANKADFLKISMEQLKEDMVKELELVKALPKLVIRDFTYLDAVGVEFKHLPDLLLHPDVLATAQYSLVDKDGRTKVGLIGSVNPAEVQNWMDAMKDELEGIYGDPARGYAGGYKPAVVE